MRRHVLTLGVVAVVALACTVTFAANRGVSFTPIGFIDDPGPWPASQVFSMSADGTQFIVSPTYYGAYCVFWTPEDGWGEHIGSAGSHCELSNDGSTVVASGYMENGMRQAATWAGTVGEWNFIPAPDGFEPCGTSGVGFYGQAGNADYIAGLTWEGCSYARAYVYDGATGTTTELGSPNGDSTRGNDVDMNGNVVGWNRMLYGSWRGAEHVDGEWRYIDGQGPIEPKICVDTGKYCTHNGGDPETGCPEYVNDAYCSKAVCENNACVGGPYDGQYCTSNWACGGYCHGGPNDGDICTSDYYCPDTNVCVDNPEWDNLAYKGEAYAVTEDGQYTVGFEYGDPGSWGDPGFDPLLFASAWRRGPDGSFDQILPPPGASPYDSWTPIAISDDGGTIVGRYGWWIFSYPVIWTEETGTLDLQWFLVGQGLDELWYWYLTNAVAVSADGTKIGGAGSNPNWWQEGFVVDITKAKVCHRPAGDPDKARTLTISWDSIGDHLAHGDDLATCEFVQSGARSRSLDMRPERPADAKQGPAADFNPMIPDKQFAIEQMNSRQGSPSVNNETSVELGNTDETPVFETADVERTAENQQRRARAPRSPRRMAE